MKPKEKKKDLVEMVPDDQPYNPYTEIQVLSQHLDIVRFLLKIDDRRCASAAEDCLVIIWDIEVGIRLHMLQGHTRPVTCMCLLQPHSGIFDEPVLLTGASDKQVCMWEVESGARIRMLGDLGAPVRCLAVLEKGVFCGAGENLCVWNRDGTLLQKYSRTAHEDIQQIIVMRNDLVTVVDKQIVIYSVTDTSTEDGKISRVEISVKKELPPHRESIRALIQVNDSCFASASLDGAIILWTVAPLMKSREFNHVEEYKGHDNTYSHSVQHMVAVEERFIVAAVGSGFCVYDAITGRCLAQKENAHYSKIQHLQFVYNGVFLATCSEDGAIRLWGSPITEMSLFPEAKDKEDPKKYTNPNSTCSMTERLLGMRKEDLKKLDNKKTVRINLLGELLGHSGAVQMCLDFEVEGFVSCGSDRQLIVWKDGCYQGQKRNETIREAVFGVGSHMMQDNFGAMGIV